MCLDIEPSEEHRLIVYSIDDLYNMESTNVLLLSHQNECLARVVCHLCLQTGCNGDTYRKKIDLSSACVTLSQHTTSLNMCVELDVCM